MNLLNLPSHICFSSTRCIKYAGFCYLCCVLVYHRILHENAAHGGCPKCIIGSRCTSNHKLTASTDSTVPDGRAAAADKTLPRLSSPVIFLFSIFSLSLLFFFPSFRLLVFSSSGLLPFHIPFGRLSRISATAGHTDPMVWSRSKCRQSVISNISKR